MPQAQKRRGLSQETLKIIACGTMLLDHIGACLFPRQLWLRVIGRIAFPIYCFLLVEGVYHTKRPLQYLFRLTIGMILSEYFFDAALFGGWTWQHQSVIVTLVLAYIMVRFMLLIPPLWGKLLIILPFALAAELLNTDYGALGIALVAMFVLTRRMRHRSAIQAFCICLLSVFYQGVPTLEPLAVMALLPIDFYSGRKAANSRVIQWTFYLFYPVHLAILLLVQNLL